MKSSPPGAATSPAGGRLVFLDGIRALAATAVVLNHVYQTVTSEGTIRGHASLLGYGNFAVAVFIVVSGYSLAVASARRAGGHRFGSFIRRRAWRILPPYIAALALSVVLTLTVIGSKTGTPWDLVLPLSWSGVGVNALLLQDVVMVRAPNHVFWSIAVEWHLYFLFPALMALRRRLSLISLLFLGAIGCALLWIPYGGKPYVGFPPQFFGLFVLGAVAGGLITDQNLGVAGLQARLRPWSTLAAVALAVPLGVLLVQVDRSFFFAELVLGAAVAAFIVSLTPAPRHPVRRLLEWRPLAWIGLFSYSLYLTHAPVLQILWEYGVRPLRLGPDAEFLATLFGATAASLSVAFAFHLVFERPFTKHRSLRAMSRARRRNRVPPADLRRFRELAEDIDPSQQEDAVRYLLKAWSAGPSEESPSIRGT